MISVSQSALSVTWFELAPFQLEQYGNMGIAASYNSGSEGGVDRYSQDLSAVGEYAGNAYSSGYIYRPWVVLFNTNGRLNAQLQQYDVYSNQLQNSLTWGLGNNFVLYPYDSIPTNFYVNFDQTLVSGSVDNVFNNFRLGGNNRIAFDLGSLFNRYEFRNETESDIERDFKVHELELNFDGSTDAQNYYSTIKVDYRNASTVTLNNDDLNMLFNYNHSFRYGNQSSSSFSATYSTNARHADVVSTDVDNARFFNNNTWYFSGLPELSLNLSNQIYRFEQISKNENEWNALEQMTMSSSFSADYDWSDQIAIFASLLFEDTGTVGKQEDVEYYQSDSSRYFEQTGIRWQENYDIGFATYNTFTSTNVTAIQGEEESTVVLLDLSHGLRRGFTVGQSYLTTAISQAYSKSILIVGSDDFNEHLDQYIDINLSMGETYNTNFYGRYAYYMSLDDTNEKEQRFDLGLDISTYQSSRVTYGGNFNYNWSNRQYSDNRQDISGSGYGSLWYNHKDLFDIWGLRLESTLNVPFEDVFFDDGSNDDIPTLNVLFSYEIGALEVRVNSVLTESSEFYSLSVRRSF